MAALYDAHVLDTGPEEDFDDIALLASQICGTPVGLVSLVDRDRQWLKAKVGTELEAMPRDLSFCAHTITSHELLEVPDAQEDGRFADNPGVGPLGIRFYAGAPVVLDGTYSVGTVCVVDREPRVLTSPQRRALRSLARHASVQLELRRYARHAGEIADQMRQVDRMKDSFLATVSHELRTPLSTIRGYLEMLLEDDFDAETSRRFLSVMSRNSDRLLRLIDELLLLNHLLVNAIKFTQPDGEITVDSTAEGEPELLITDTGVGIAAEELPHVFDRFYRCTAAEVMAAQGPGLGLAIVKSIVEAHHGSVHVQSEPGEGTTVRLTLPR
uniref:GAF domain-containing sensor histidine kinase n=1 Tax=Paractinoplanes polyasparticus TaxID=2856853 RepID=UPI002105F4A2|nr:ATP-binding protein [Actinoplanes polyasparticus]